MENKKNNDIVFEDISSSSKPISPTAKKAEELTRKAGRVAGNAKKLAKKSAKQYGNSAFKNIDRVIKIIAFVVAISFFALFFLGALVVFFIDKALIFLSCLMLLIGAAISLIFLFLIYGLGHLISQNNEILSRLDY